MDKDGIQPRIFVVDDDKEMADATRRVLVRMGYDVEVFHDGRLAIGEIRRQKPDLILMDMMMPDFGGDDAIREIKKDPESSDIPIIVITGVLSSGEYLEMTRIAIDGRAYKSLCKPYNSEELLRLVKESLWRMERR